MSATPAGWYPDGRGATRWWDGERWTEHVQPQTPPASGPSASNTDQATNATGSAVTSAQTPTEPQTQAAQTQAAQTQAPQDAAPQAGSQGPAGSETGAAPASQASPAAAASETPPAPQTPGPSQPQSATRPGAGQTPAAPRSPEASQAQTGAASAGAGSSSTPPAYPQQGGPGGGRGKKPLLIGAAAVVGLLIIAAIVIVVVLTSGGGDNTKPTAAPAASSSPSSSPSAGSSASPGRIVGGVPKVTGGPAPVGPLLVDGPILLQLPPGWHPRNGKHGTKQAINSSRHAVVTVLTDGPRSVHLSFSRAHQAFDRGFARSVAQVRAAGAATYKGHRMFHSIGRDNSFRLDAYGWAKNGDLGYINTVIFTTPNSMASSQRNALISSIMNQIQVSE